ncbi:MAG: PH domain-containing protein [Verrucomicrobiota bacterium]
MKIYQAPWGKTLKVLSLVMVLLAVAMLFGASFLPGGTLGWRIGTRFGLAAVVLACLPFMVLGYEITADAILIRRPLWKTRLELKGLISAVAVPNAMEKCLRTCGNGGMFSFTGWFWNNSLGTFSAYVTDHERTVVLRFEKRTVVVSPDRPEDFVRELTALDTATGDRRHGVDAP